MNPTVMTAAEVKRRKHARDHFVTSVLKEKKTFMIGNGQELEAIAG